MHKTSRAPPEQTQSMLGHGQGQDGMKRSKSQEKRYEENRRVGIHAPPQTSRCKPHRKKKRDRDAGWKWWEWLKGGWRGQGALWCCAVCWLVVLALERNDGIASPGGWLSIRTRGLGRRSWTLDTEEAKKHKRQGGDADARKKAEKQRGGEYEKGNWHFLFLCLLDERGRKPGRTHGHEESTRDDLQGEGRK